MKRWHVIAAISLVVLALAGWGVATGVRRMFYPLAPPMPPVVKTSTAELLSRLDQVLKSKAPQILDGLQPGLSSSEISTLENQSGFVLPDDLKALYSWHNGSKSLAGGHVVDFIPGHYFKSLQEAVAERNELRRQYRESGVINKVAFQVFAGHTLSWVHILDDRASDGYFYDPDRNPAQGAIFFHFAQDGSYEFFPSVKNLLAAIAKCYEQEVCRSDGSRPRSLKDIEAEYRIWDEFGAGNQPR